MSPLAWNSKREYAELLINQNSFEITVDLDVLVGINKQMKEDGE